MADAVGPLVGNEVTADVFSAAAKKPVVDTRASVSGESADLHLHF